MSNYYEKNNDKEILIITAEIRERFFYYIKLFERE